MRVDWLGVRTTGLLTAFALGVGGYHPFAEDGGVYGAGIKRVLDPGMYGARPEFVTEHLRFSLFAPMVAGVVRVSHAPLEWVLLGLYLASVWATLYAAWMIAERVTESVAGRCGSVTLLACWLTLPIAGTSLMLVDPYLTARSLTTALVLMAIAGALRGGWLMAAASLVAAATMHPLMAAYGLAAVVVLAVVATGRWQACAALGAAALLLAAVVQGFAPAESADYLWVERTRYYWFLSEWHWYEWMGLAAPMLVLAWLGRRRENAALARGGVVLGVISAAVALGFARIAYQTHLVARLQPLRCFQLVYVFMILLLGAWLGERVLTDKAWRWAAILVVLGGTMFFVQRNIYPAGAHVEWPGSAPRNEWEQAFLWVRANTPKDALFAMNAHYIQADGEDAQCFRAIAERDALPDYSKDGGEASIMPSLTDAWVQGQAAQARIDEEGDEERAAKLKGLGVGWVVLQARSPTAWECPYGNGLVKVCQVP
jgi:hypothetical protein